MSCRASQPTFQRLQRICIRSPLSVLYPIIPTIPFMPLPALSRCCRAAAVDFFNVVSLLYGIVADGAAQFDRPGEGFPPGFEYLWVPEGAKGKGRKP